MSDRQINVTESNAWDKATEIVKDYANLSVDGFREKYGIKTDRFGWTEVVAAFDTARTEISQEVRIDSESPRGW